jgi:methylated-DNA-[protein]-cysteine S-methyltransferase
MSAEADVMSELKTAGTQGQGLSVTAVCSAKTEGAALRFLLRYHARMNYQAKLKAPFGVLGIRCTDEVLTGIDFLSAPAAVQPPSNKLARKVCEQLSAYFADSRFRFDLPLQTGGTAHQKKVWQAMRAIPSGKVQSYGELAAGIGSAPLAVGQACGNNPIPVVIPCHRVVGKSGIGGFAKHRDGHMVDIKRWLLAHEGVL